MAMSNFEIPLNIIAPSDLRAVVDQYVPTSEYWRQLDRNDLQAQEKQKQFQREFVEWMLRRYPYEMPFVSEALAEEFLSSSLEVEQAPYSRVRVYVTALQHLHTYQSQHLGNGHPKLITPRNSSPNSSISKFLKRRREQYKAQRAQAKAVQQGARGTGSGTNDNKRKRQSHDNGGNEENEAPAPAAMRYVEAGYVADNSSFSNVGTLHENMMGNMVHQLAPRHVEPHPAHQHHEVQQAHMVPMNMDRRIHVPIESTSHVQTDPISAAQTPPPRESQQEHQHHHHYHHSQTNHTNHNLQPPVPTVQPEPAPAPLPPQATISSTMTPGQCNPLQATVPSTTAQSQYNPRKRKRCKGEYSNRMEKMGWLCSGLFRHSENNPKELGFDLRDRLLFLANHYFFESTEVTRNIRLSDLDFYRQSLEGTISGLDIMKFGTKLTINTAVRHAQVTVCPVSALALLLFQRFEVEKEPLPDFSNMEWHTQGLFNYSQHLRKDSTVLSERYYRARRLAVEQKTGDSPTRSRDNMKRATQYMEDAGVSADDLMWVWGYGTVPDTLPFVRVLGGYPAFTSDTRLPRDIFPEPGLMEQIFTTAGEQLEHIQVRWGSGQATNKAERFLQMLVRLRKVVLQDAAILMELFPKLPLWQHHVFRDPAFETFKLRVRAAHSATAPPPPQQPQSVHASSTPQSQQRILPQVQTQYPAQLSRPSQRQRQPQSGSAQRRKERQSRARLSLDGQVPTPVSENRRRNASVGTPVNKSGHSNRSFVPFTTQQLTPQLCFTPRNTPPGLSLSSASSSSTSTSSMAWNSPSSMANSPIVNHARKQTQNY